MAIDIATSNGTMIGITGTIGAMNGRDIGATVGIAVIIAAAGLNGVTIARSASAADR